MILYSKSYNLLSSDSRSHLQSQPHLVALPPNHQLSIINMSCKIYSTIIKLCSIISRGKVNLACWNSNLSSSKTNTLVQGSNYTGLSQWIDSRYRLIILFIFLFSFFQLSNLGEGQELQGSPCVGGVGHLDDQLCHLARH